MIESVINSVALVMGSDSDMPIVKKAAEVLKRLEIPYSVHIISAHRTPEAAAEFAKHAMKNGYGVIIAFAGKAAHLAGVIAAHTVLPVIGVPIKSADLGGLDALLSTVQMPSGVPVATVAIDGGANAAWLAARILALGDKGITIKLIDAKLDMEREVAEKNKKIADML